MRRSLLVASLLFVAPFAAHAQAKPAAAPAANKTLTELWAREQGGLQAILKNDVAAMKKFFNRDMAYLDANGPMLWKPAMAEEIAKNCQTKNLSASNPQLMEISPGLVALSYDVQADQVCGGQKQPPKTHAISVYQKVGNEWAPIAHAESPFAAAPVNLAPKK